MRVKRTLVLDLERRDVSVGDTITVRVRDTTNRPIEGARIEAGSGRHWTDSTGRCQLKFTTPGFQKLVARKAATDRVRYEPATALVRALPATKTPHLSQYR
ncbi:carboxypeptidase-like regulatory domain-containing protein [Natronolimnobius baerhuensis]|uniref:Carboxypeptidase regulatory-like domain-containing protein n=1 Tax=Natronolimnobius baerhuensis TaxID=253108 RepID=A0A202EDU9_9EURY|nr:carboxypeptidase-like regulatory domain-containing protein [Natronolimnobius baerhuensis]OVE86358.1 hypothetical protein B2G88_06155 [Natronolimnobius baerhuensis]